MLAVVTHGERGGRAGDAALARSGLRRPGNRRLAKQKLDRWRVRYVAKTKARFPERGLVSIVVHQRNEIRGFALERAWVPAAKARLGDAILTSFKL